MVGLLCVAYEGQFVDVRRKLRRVHSVDTSLSNSARCFSVSNSRDRFRPWRTRQSAHSKSETKAGKGKKGGGSHKGPNTRSLHAAMADAARSRLCAVSRRRRLSLPSHHTGRVKTPSSGKPGVFHQPPSPQMLCRSRCSPCAPYGSPTRIHGSQSTSSEQENTERVLKEN